MISGGGSAQVDPIGGNAIAPPGKGATHWQQEIWFPTSPLKAIQARAPKATVKYDAGTILPQQLPLPRAPMWPSSSPTCGKAKAWTCRSLACLTTRTTHRAVGAANPHTIVVLETGSPVTMPWVDAPAAILEAWFGGSDGANALGNILFGSVNPSGKLPNTFPKSEADLPHPTLTTPPPGIATLLRSRSRLSNGPGVCRRSR